MKDLPVMSAVNAAALMADADTLAFGSFGPSGGPKVVPAALAILSTKRYDILAGASSGLDGILQNNMARRAPFQADPDVRAKINDGRVAFVEYHLAELPRQMQYQGTRPDFCVVEAAEIINGEYLVALVPTTTVGNYADFLQLSKKVIVEVNAAVPQWVTGMHNFSMDIRTANNCPFVYVDRSKIAAVVYTNEPETCRAESAPKDPQLGYNVCDFLQSEVDKGRMTSHLKPIEIGVGVTGDAVGMALVHCPWFHGLHMWSEVAAGFILAGIDNGKLEHVSASGLYFTKEEAKQFFSARRYKEHISLRPLSMSNAAGNIQELNVIAINGAIEANIYGAVNSTIIDGNLMNGIGGSGEFARNALVSIFVMESTAKRGTVSTILPALNHVDHTAPDVDVLVTEQGYADLRGLSPRERAQVIINNCSHPSYRPWLQAEFDRMTKDGGYIPYKRTTHGETV